MTPAGAENTIGLYVHVPFCERVCPYCDFAVEVARPLRPADEARYVDALLNELESSAGGLADPSLSSIYIGGGTPSLLRPGSVQSIVSAARAAFASAAVDALEVTLEVNPSTVERDRLPDFRRAGVNRLSIGVQSFDDTVLRRLGRAHRSDEARATVAAARAAGFENLSIDLIFGAPGGSAEQLASDLAEIVRLEPQHVSIYELTIEAGTPFALAEQRGQITRPDEEQAAAALERIGSVLGAAGIARYEISNYARPGRESRHNRRYWRREPVLGIGLSAASLLPQAQDAPHGARRVNLRALGRYLERVEAGESPVAEHEVLEPGTARGEALFLGLRQLAGIDAKAFCAEFGAPPRAFFGDAIEELCAAGLLLEAADAGLRLSERGLLLADEVARHFV
jgi:oxygen-independent coproporphyrinogen-3 oxidase